MTAQHWVFPYLYIWAFRSLIFVGEGHVTAKPEAVGLVINVHLVVVVVAVVVVVVVCVCVCMCVCVCVGGGGV